MEEFKRILKDQKVVLMCDETTDRMGRCVFIVLIRVLTGNSEQRVFVGGVKELMNANGAECSRAILSVIAEYEIKYEDIVGVITDSARYMTKCVDSIRILFSGDMAHIQCWAHKLNIVASLWSSSLSELNTCVQNAKSAFVNTRKRKHRYYSFLSAKYPTDPGKPKLFPSPVMTRWNSWFNSVQYLNEYLDDLIEFLSEVEGGGSCIEYFKNIKAQQVYEIKCSSQFLLEHGSSLIEMIVVLEGSTYPFIHKLYSKLTDLQNSFFLVSRGTFGLKTREVVETVTSAVRKCTVQEQLKSVGLQCNKKLTSLLDKDTTGILVKSMSKLFDTRNISINLVDDSLWLTAKNVPLLGNISQKEFCEGYLAFQAQVKAMLEEQGDVDILSVLLGLKEEHHNFVKNATAAVWIPPSNVDSERAFSAYGQILTDMRTNLKSENIQIMLSKYFARK